MSSGDTATAASATTAAASATGNAPPPAADDNTHPADDDKAHRPTVETLRTPVMIVDLTRPALGLFALFLALMIAVPLFKTAEPIDFLALACLLPAALGLAWVVLRRRESVAASQLFARFVIAWIMIVPIAIAAVSFICLFVVLSTFTINLMLPGIVAGVLMVFGAVAILVYVEEQAKLLALAWLDRYDTMTQPQHYPYYSTALSMGLATGESYYLVLFIRALLDAIALANSMESRTSSSSSSKSPIVVDATVSPVPSPPHGSVVTVPVFLTVLVICMVLFIPLHACTSYHIGLAVARVQVLKHSISVYRVLAQAVLIRSWFVFSFLVLSVAINGLVALISCLATFVAYVFIVKHYERKMPQRYLRATGYMTILGYGALPQNEADADDDADHASHSAAAVEMTPAATGVAPTGGVDGDKAAAVAGGGGMPPRNAGSTDSL